MRGRGSPAGEAMAGRISRAAAGTALLFALSGCGLAERLPWPRPAGDRVEIVFDEVAAPEAYRAAGPASVDAEGAPGLWAAVPGLARPERGRVARRGRSVTVALFAAPEGEAIRLSRGAAAAIGLGPEDEAEVTVTAIRREPRLARGASSAFDRIVGGLYGDGTGRGGSTVSSTFP